MAATEGTRASGAPMTELTERSDRGGLARLRRVGRAAAYVAVGLPVTTIMFTVAVTAAGLTVGLMFAFLVGIPVGWLSAMVMRGGARLERSRANTYRVGIVDPVLPLSADTWWRRVVERARSRARWREFAYHVASFPISVMTFVITVTAWCGALALVVLPFVLRTMPDDVAHFWFFDISEQGPGRWIAALVGLVGLVVVAPLITVGAADLQWSLARRLLGPNERDALAAQVADARSRRASAVSSAEAERRRIERDLHDGAQQRLVALAATLGAARQRLGADPADPEVSEMVGVAHDEAKAALGEIRDLVRGIHPAILDDRGIDAALSAVIARSLVPVELDVQLGERPPAAVESAAYFVVSEALTNVARHSGATRARVSIAQTANRLVVEITDDGHGGADPSKGTGLAGLRERVAGMGGTSELLSPPGGPTTIVVELPCES